MESGKLKTENVLRKKSYAFAIRSVKLYKFLADEHREYVLSKQALRSGTSIGANIAEGSQAQSKSDFIHKLSISLKEAFETQYWLELLRDCEYLKPDHAESMLTDCSELQRILTASIKTAKRSLK
jgi:four helix bundle protein